MVVYSFRSSLLKPLLSLHNFLGAFSEEIFCDSLPNIENGYWNDSSCNSTELQFPIVCKLTCEDNYTLVGNDTILCGEDGEFKPEEFPVCKG